MLDHAKEALALIAGKDKKELQNDRVLNEDRGSKLEL
jgi:hypothetical protein